MVVVIESTGANIASIRYALSRLGVEANYTKDPQAIVAADKVLLPGVGSAKHAMDLLETNQLSSVIKQLSQPVLGICLGMQLMFDYLEEGNCAGLGVIPGDIRQLPVAQDFTIPHMGWNTVVKNKVNEPILSGFDQNSYCYFVHSFYAPVSQYTVATTEYSASISAIINKDNFYGCQFHPEKSSSTGLLLLKNFLEL